LKCCNFYFLLFTFDLIMADYFVHPSSFIDEPCRIGKGVKIWHFSHVMTHSVIGDECNIGQNVMIGSHVVLGRNVKVQNNVSVYEGVICEDDVFLGPSMVFTNVINPRSTVVRKNEFKKTLVQKGASIGANATIICGITIGAYAMIGAGAVVTIDVPAFALMAGNPARQIGWVSKNGQKLFFDQEGFARCTATNELYQLVEGKVTPIPILNLTPSPSPKERRAIRQIKKSNKSRSK
jgi:UDP-2-acetamido-3-amino-2,3-dideoxy-glucuronate N-acetyltransferase